MLTAVEFRRLVQGDLELLSINGKAAQFQALPPAPSAVAWCFLKAVTVCLLSPDSQCPFGLYTLRVAASRCITSKCHQPLHLLQIVCTHVCVHKHTQSPGSLASRGWGRRGTFHTARLHVALPWEV
jgi:hypothetical protein